MATHELIIAGWRPALDNELFRLHWGARARRKKRDVNVIAHAALSRGVPRASGRRRVKITLYGRYHRGAIPDEPAPLKSLLDALVQSGLIVDDSAEWLEIDWPPRYLPGPKATHLVIEDIES